MNTLTTVLMVLVGLLNAVPVVAVVSRQRVERMYGVRVDSLELEILLRHRAVLFGVVGALLFAGAFFASLRIAAMSAGFASMGSFVWIAGRTAGPIRRIVLADAAGIALLAVVAIGEAI